MEEELGDQGDQAKIDEIVNKHADGDFLNEAVLSLTLYDTNTVVWGLDKSAPPHEMLRQHLEAGQAYTQLGNWREAQQEFHLAQVEEGGVRVLDLLDTGKAANAIMDTKTAYKCFKLAVEIISGLSRPYDDGDIDTLCEVLSQYLRFYINQSCYDDDDEHDVCLFSRFDREIFWKLRDITAEYDAVKWTLAVTLHDKVVEDREANLKENQQFDNSSYENSLETCMKYLKALIYDPDSHPYLARIHSLIGCQLAEQCCDWEYQEEHDKSVIVHLKKALTFWRKKQWPLDDYLYILNSLNTLISVYVGQDEAQCLNNAVEMEAFLKNYDTDLKKISSLWRHLPAPCSLLTHSFWEQGCSFGLLVERCIYLNEITGVDTGKEIQVFASRTLKLFSAAKALPGNTLPSRVDDLHLLKIQGYAHGILGNIDQAINFTLEQSTKLEMKLSQSGGECCQYHDLSLGTFAELQELYSLTEDGLEETIMYIEKFHALIDFPRGREYKYWDSPCWYQVRGAKQEEAGDLESARASYALAEQGFRNYIANNADSGLLADYGKFLLQRGRYEDALRELERAHMKSHPCPWAENLTMEYVRLQAPILLPEENLLFGIHNVMKLSFPTTIVVLYLQVRVLLELRRAEDAQMTVQQLKEEIEKVEYRYHTSTRKGLAVTEETVKAMSISLLHIVEEKYHRFASV